MLRDLESLMINEGIIKISLILLIIAVGIRIIWSLVPRTYAVELDIMYEREDLIIKGRPDKIKQRWGGKLEVIDYKSRALERVYSSDRVQLSIYAYILNKSGKKVSQTGLIQFKSGLIKQVDLMSEKEVESLIERYLKHSQCKIEKINKTRNKKLCNYCKFYKKECV